MCKTSGRSLTRSGSVAIEGPERKAARRPLWPHSGLLAIAVGAVVALDAAGGWVFWMGAGLALVGGLFVAYGAYETWREVKNARRT